MIDRSDGNGWAVRSFRIASNLRILFAAIAALLGFAALLAKLIVAGQYFLVGGLVGAVLLAGFALARWPSLWVLFALVMIAFVGGLWLHLPV
jgi:hypothetical protein